MSRDNDTTPARGETWYNGDTIDSSNLGGVNLEGTIKRFEDLDPSARTCRSNREVWCMLVRNVGAAALLPKQSVTLQKSGLNYLGRVDGKVTTTAERCFPVDEYLPAAGCPVNDLCWIVIEGPAMCLTGLGADANNVINVGDPLVSITGVTSGSTTAGRVGPMDLITAITGTSSGWGLAANQVMNYIGRALSAKTTTNTNANVLVDIIRKI